ncbi:hypothetical protein NM688_g5991 [Phlebia brevispora]|uniref:Uncharacterized protein n=1 Tax=Phlebia brevispora TaxID=194682 RepID=A0ACC1SLE1_9APHY|nr:hypothetical protein NM688_g5991 [Phlebia brevispora]
MRASSTRADATAKKLVFEKLLKAEDRPRLVTTLRVTGTIAPDATVYHWHIELCLAPTEDGSESNDASRTVVFDMTPTGPGEAGILIVKSNSDSSTSFVPSDQFELDIQVKERHTVQEYLNFFVNKGMQRYKFDDTGSGCYHWVVTVLAHLESNGWIPQGSLSDLEAFRAEQRKLRPDNIPTPYPKGQFY